MTVPPATPYPPPPPPKRSWGKWVLLGCVALILIFGAIGGAIWWGVSKATEGPETTVRAFITGVSSGDVAAAHATFSVPLKEIQSEEQLAAMMRENPAFFAIKDVSFNNRSIDQNGAELSGNVTLESGTTLPAEFKCVRENGDWKLIAWHFGS